MQTRTNNIIVFVLDNYNILFLKCLQIKYVFVFILVIFVKAVFVFVFKHLWVLVFVFKSTFAVFSAAVNYLIICNFKAKSANHTNAKAGYASVYRLHSTGGNYLNLKQSETDKMKCNASQQFTVDYIVNRFNRNSSLIFYYMVYILIVLSQI